VNKKNLPQKGHADRQTFRRARRTISSAITQRQLLAMHTGKNILIILVSVTK